MVGSAADTVDGTNVNVPVNSNAGQVAQDFSDLMERIKAVYNPRSYNFTDYGTGGIDGNRYTPFRYGGMMGDGPFIVGEQGPELGYKIGSSVRIFSNPETNKMLANGGAMSGGPVNVYVTKTDASPYEIGKEVLWAAKVAG
jgi:hypothetical protein